MAIFYLDPENGNDANSGTTFANRWKTITSGATAARVNPGDTIRIIASRDPVSIGNATWTNQSEVVTLAAAKTTNIYLDGAWTASANVTCTANTTRKEGTDSSQIGIAAAFTTGKAAYFPTGTLNLSNRQQISFWFRQSAGTVHSNAAWLTLSLCSDALGNTPVNSFSIPPLSGANTWHVFTIDNGAALGSSIQSIALYVNTDNAAQTFQIDNVIACNAPGSADCLTLNSVIGKNTGTGEAWWGIRSINGTSVILEDWTNSSAATASRGYYQGVTETVATYAISPLFNPGNVNTIQDGGNSSSPLTFSGGWNRTDMSTQTGETFLDGTNSAFPGINTNGNNFVNIERLSVCRASSVQLYGSGINASLNNICLSTSVLCHGGTSVGRGATVSINNLVQTYSTLDALELGTSPAPIKVTVGNIDSTTGGGGIIRVSGAIGNDLTITNIRNGGITTQRTILFNSDTSANNTIRVTTSFVQPGTTPSNVLRGVNNIVDLSQCATFSYPLPFNQSATVTQEGSWVYLGTSTVTGSIFHGGFVGGTFTGAIGSATSQASSIRFVNSNISGATIVTLPYLPIIVTNQNGIQTDNRIYSLAGTIFSDTATRHTPSGMSWMFTNRSQATADYSPLITPIAAVACNGGALVTVKCWVMRVSTNINAGIRVLGQVNAGIAETTTLMTAGNNTWEEITLTFTPTNKCVVQIYGLVYANNNASSSAYFDDMTITQS